MFISEQNGAQMWRKMLNENFNVTDSEKLNWVSEYAAIHEIHESQIGINGAAGYVPAQPGGVNPIYANPLNTTGMGNVAAPQNPNVHSTMPAAPGNLWNQTAGSGDIPVSTLPMALNVALLTIGLELVPVIPAKGPWAMLTYMDFPYAGGKLGRVNETAFDGKGYGRENKPIYIKVLGNTKELSAIIKKLREDAKAAAAERKDLFVTVVSGEDVNVWTKTTKGTGVADLGTEAEQTKTHELGKDVTNAYVDTANDFSFRADKDANKQAVTFIGKFKGIGRNDGGILLETVSCLAADKTPASITELFACGAVTVNGKNLTEAKADFVQTSADLVDGFANFVDGSKQAMTRAQNETGTGNVIGLRLFSKWIQMGSYEVTGTVTRQQLQDLPLYGVDAVGKVMEALQNEITQHINQRILERVFALGVTNAQQQKAFQNVDLNLWMATQGTTVADYAGTHVAFGGINNMMDIYGNDHNAAADWADVKNAEVLTSAENTHTRQRRISSRILAAANLIQTVGRRGRATWVVTNAKVASALQDVSGYVVAPMVNNLAQDGSQNLFLAGTIAGLHVYVDPYMTWEDTRICVGRKGDGNSPGVVFMPYILADTVSITAEGTMAPKMLVNSRYAIAEAGFYPELQYYTFAVDAEMDII